MLLSAEAMTHSPALVFQLSLFDFEETLVQLLIGVLFVLVAASVSPHELRSVMPWAPWRFRVRIRVHGRASAGAFFLQIS
jgi:hypothetical protein